MYTDQGQPGSGGAVTLTKHHQALAARLAGQAFELLYG